MINLNPLDPRALHEQITEKIRDMIIYGYIEKEDKIPSVRELASKLTINPNTIQKAYKELETEGYIYSRQGKGYYVSATKKTESKIPDLKTQFEKIVVEMKFLGCDKEELKKIIDEI